jgi:multidrug efflux system membrane fusion protein
VALSNISNATTVPHDALTSGPEGQYVYRISQGRAEQIPVTVLFDDSRNVAVEGNLKPGDQVVVDGQLEAVPGGQVQVVTGVQAGPAQSGGRRRGAGRKKS